MSLRRSEGTHDTIASAERNKSTVKQKKGGFKEVRIKEVAKNGNKEAEIKTG